MSTPTDRPRRRPRPTAPMTIGAVVALAAIISGGVTGVGSTGAYLTSTGHATVVIGTADACASGTPYATYAATLPAPLVWWRFAEASGAGSVDGEGGTAGGAVTGTGPAALGLGGPGLAECDTTGGLTLAGAPAGEAFVRGPSDSAPATLTAALLIRTTSGAGGGLLSFGDGAAGPSTVVPYRLSLDTEGRVVFDIVTTDAPVQLRSSVVERVDDGDPHLVVVTVAASAPDRVATLYVDGIAVDTATVGSPTPATPVALQTGGGDLDDADAVVDEVLVWSGTALAADAVADLWDSDHW